MTIKRTPKRSLSPVPQASPLALLESLADTRISVLYLARQAKEAKNTALAKELTKKGQSLRTEIARIRQTVTTAWNTETQTIIDSAAIARSDLTQLIEEAEKSAKKIAVFTRALGVASNILGLAKKVL